MPRQVRTIAVWVALGAAPLGVADAAAAPGSRAEQGPVIVVMTPTSAAKDPALTGMVDAIGDHGRSVGLHVVAATHRDSPLSRAIEISRAQPSLGVFWLAPRPRGVAIYLYEPQGKGVFIREIERTDAESDGALVEAVGLSVASAAAALRGGSDLFMTPVDAEEVARMLERDRVAAESAPDAPDRDPEEPAPEPTPIQSEPAPGVRPRLAVAYLGEGFNARAPWQHGATAGVGLELPRLVRFSLGYGFLAPAAIASTPTVHMLRHAVSLDVGIGGAVARRVRLFGALVGGADFAVWRSSERRGMRPLGRLGPMFQIAIEVAEGLDIDIGVGASAVLNRPEFVLCETPSACDGTARNSVASSWPVLPRATVGLSYRPRVRGGRTRTRPSAHSVPPGRGPEK